MAKRKAAKAKVREFPGTIWVIEGSWGGLATFESEEAAMNHATAMSTPGNPMVVAQYALANQVRVTTFVTTEPID